MTGPRGRLTSDVVYPRPRTQARMDGGTDAEDLVRLCRAGRWSWFSGVLVTTGSSSSAYPIRACLDAWTNEGAQDIASPPGSRLIVSFQYSVCTLLRVYLRACNPTNSPTPPDRWFIRRHGSVEVSSLPHITFPSRSGMSLVRFCLF